MTPSDCGATYWRVDFKNLFVDGTKLEANANRYTFVWKKVVHKNEAKMFLKIQACLEEINLSYLKDFKVTKETVLDDLKPFIHSKQLKRV